MIIFKKLKYKNILSTGNSPIEINFDTCPRTLFTGHNGHGKSTVISALTFGLFGRDMRGINKHGLINSINKRNMLVEVEFDTNGKSYKIRRGMKPGIFEIYMDGKLLNQSASSRDYQKYIEENVLKLNFNSFKQIVVLSAKQYVPFMLLPASQRRDIIEDLLDIAVFTRMNSLLRDKVQATKELQSDIEKLITLELEKVRVLDEHLKKIEKESEHKREEMLSKISTMQTENEAKQATLSVLFKDVEIIRSKQQKLLEIEKKRLQVSSSLSNLKDQKRSLLRTSKFYTDQNNCPTCHQDISEDFKQKALEKANSDISELNIKEASLDQVLTKIEKALRLNTELNESLGKSSLQISKLQGEIHSNQKYIKLLEEEIEKNLTEDLEKNSIRDKIDSIHKTIAKAEKKKEELLNEREVQIYALSLLKDSGIKTKIIQTYIPMMNKLINGYLSAMDFYISFELDENFNEVIRSRHRDEFSYANFSDGEKQRIDLAILFTWRQIAKIKNSMSTNLLFLDEIGDSSLDHGGVDDLMNILDTQKDTNVFLISHKELLADRCDRVLHFEKQNNFTTVKEI
jgi:DNA repair exonuclease SbcCD ATPase subunit